jgi:hypothetical protein
LLPPELSAYSGSYDEFWTQMIRWLVDQSDFLPGQDMSVRTDRLNYSPGDTVNLSVFARNAHVAPPALSIIAPSGKTASVGLARGAKEQADFVAGYRPSEAGEYLAELSEPGKPAAMTPFTVFENDEEDLITGAEPDLMARIAGAGGGEVLTPETLKFLPEKLARARLATVQKIEPLSAWDRGWILAALLALFCAEWALRRRFGLL